jgi:hypothetical protein
MSTTQPTHEGSTDPENRRIVTPNAPAPMTAEKLAQCADPDHLDVDADERAVYAVAHQQGVIQWLDDRREYEAMGVLYVSADGERAVERWYRAAAGEFGAVERAFVADASELSPTGDAAKRYAPVVQRHEEVA